MLRLPTMANRTPSQMALFLLSILSRAMAFPVDDTCPNAKDIVYSPFKPWFDFYEGSNQLCWNFASCVFIEADEARKQV